MKIPVILNGDNTFIDANPETSIMSVLRKMGYSSVKCGCDSGICGSCSILFNDKPSAACKIPVGIAYNSDITTLEYFSQTEEYRTIMKGFELAQINLCGYCDAGKIFSTYEVLKFSKSPTREELADRFKQLAPCCTDLTTLINGVIWAWEIQHKGLDYVMKLQRGR